MKAHRLFINYRSIDTGETASALYRDLVKYLGDQSVFIDHDKIEGGEEWPKRLWNEVEAATAMLCLIGEDWLTAWNPELQQRRLETPEDWVRAEICRALQRGITIIPILIERASIPTIQDMPEVLSPLLSLQARRLRRTEWNKDLALILQDLGYNDNILSMPIPPNTNFVVPVTTVFSPRQKDVRLYLTRLIETMQERNNQNASGIYDDYIELAAEDRETSSPRQQDYPREKGRLLAFPHIQPAIAEVEETTGSVESIMAVSDVIGLQTRTVHNLLGVLRSHRDPLVLLGEPGSGKSTTLRKLAIDLANRALGSPGAPIPVYVELGTFRQRIDRDPNAAIIDLIRNAVPPGVNSLRQHIRPGAITAPIVVLFDAMDEIPRFGDYTERTSALAAFATGYISVARTVFTCRTNDFDASFGHRQLVLKPFDERRIKLFLKKSLGNQFQVNGEPQTPRSAARRLIGADELGAEAKNPLTLSMAVNFIRKWQAWPRGRAPLFEDNLVALADRSFRRKGIAPTNEQLRETVDAWAGIAYEIFKYDGAVFIEQKELEALVGNDSIDLAVGGGLLMLDKEANLLKFRHHRLQEFLVARRFLLPNPPQPQWADMLASPRWQETLLNYFAIGGYNDRVLKVIVDSLSPAENYFSRLRPIVDQSQKVVMEAKKAYDIIQPDVHSDAGEAGVISSYSAEQQAKKDTAGQRLELVRLRSKRLKTIPLDRETTWSDRVLFAARLSALLKPSLPGTADIRQLLSHALTGLLDFGRPSAQVRMLAAWREISDWCPVAVLDPVRESSLTWVRAQTIHAMLTTPLLRDRIDHAFSEELEWEVLNLRLPDKLSLFWETAIFHLNRKLQIGFAVLIHLAFVLVTLVAVITTGAIIIPRISLAIPLFATLSPILLWFGWLGTIGVITVLTVPVLQWALITRIALANAIAGGICLSHLLIIEKSNLPKLFGDGWFNFLSPPSWILAPAMISSGAFLLLALGYRSIFSFFIKNKGIDIVFNRDIKGSKVFMQAWKTGIWTLLLGVCYIVFYLFIHTIALLELVFEYLSFAFLGIGAIGTVIIIWSILIERWNNYKSRPPITRIGLIFKEILAVIFVFIFIISILFSILFLVFIPIIDFIITLIPSEFSAIFEKIFLGIAVIFGISMMTFFISRYTMIAFNQTLAEIRYRLLRRRFRQHPFRGNLTEWEAAFRKASELKRRELMEAFDYRAMGATPQDALNTLQNIEELADIDKPVAEGYSKTMYRIQEIIRQQRWTTPNGAQEINDEKI